VGENQYQMIGLFGRGMYDAYREFLDYLEQNRQDNPPHEYRHCYDKNEHGKRYRREHGLGRPYIE